MNNEVTMYSGYSNNFRPLNCFQSDHTSKHVEDSNKHIIEDIVRQVGHLPEFILILPVFSCNKQSVMLTVSLDRVFLV